jgi:fructan beta-fructosidase
MVAIFTYHSDPLQKQGRKDFQTQGIAYSLDQGRTWTKYAGNPVIKNPGYVNFRDPKVFWHEPSKRWTMILTLGDLVNIYSSVDLKSWELKSSFGENIGAHNGTWECPDLFPMKDTDGNMHWVMLVSIIPGGPNGGTATQYFIGDFDGSVFTPADSITRWLDYGRDNYAGITFNNIPENDDRRIFIGWMSNWDYANLVPTTAWRNGMTLPRTLDLFKRGDSYYVKSSPVKELNSIEEEADKIDLEGLSTLKDSLYHIHLLFEKIESGFMLKLSNEVDECISFGYSSGEFRFDRTRSGLSDFHPEFAGLHTAPFSGNPRSMAIDIYVDLSSIEVFINDGELVFTELVFPSEPYRIFEVTRGKELISNATVQKMNSIWKRRNDVP